MERSEPPAAPLPALKRGTPGIPDRPRYREQYGVIIVCPDEATQKRIFEGLQALGGLKLKLVVT